MTRVRERGFPADPEPLPVPVADNHTHLESIAHVLPAGVVAPTVAEHFARARAAGVDRIVQVGCDLLSARWTVEQLTAHCHPAHRDFAQGDRLRRSSSCHPAHRDFARHRLRGAESQDLGDAATLRAQHDSSTTLRTQHDRSTRNPLVGAIAIHPNEAVMHAGAHDVGPDGQEYVPAPHHATPLDDAIAEIAVLARANPRVRAIGETGLDYFRTGPRGAAVQRDAFRAHLALARELSLPVQIHDRDAHSDVLAILQADGAPERTVFHCFSGDEAMAREVAANGWFLSLAGPITYKANDELRRAARAVPLSQLLVETDAPYLTPLPFRGQPNAPFVVAHTVRALALILEQPLERVCSVISDTSDQVYGPW